MSARVLQRCHKSEDLPPASTLEQALEQLSVWLESPTLLLLGERPDHFLRLAAMLRSSQVIGPRVHDARIAALCVLHGVEALISLDRDFSRFPTLRTLSPVSFGQP
jgi:uncharacterized protein